MDFNLTEEQQLMQQMAREYAQKSLKEKASELDEQEHFPAEAIPEMAGIGLFGLPVSDAYGGIGVGTLENTLVIEELSKVCASTGAMICMHSSFCCEAISSFGSEEQKMKYLPGLAAGENLGAFSLTEPGAGSDAAGQKTTAEDKGDHFLLNGSKIFVSNGSYADIYIVFAVTDKEAGNRGISAFIVEKDMEGFSFGTKEKKMGIRGSATYELVFTNTPVPKENLLGSEGEGFKIAMKAIDSGRIGIAAQALGIAQGAIDVTIPHVQQREQFGKTISSFQNTQFELAQMLTNVNAARMLVYQAACAKDSGEEYSHLASMAKLFAAETASDVTRRCLQLFGGYGYTREYPVERMMRDAKITELYGGTNEIQKIIISRWMGVQ